MKKLLSTIALATSLLSGICFAGTPQILGAGVVACNDCSTNQISLHAESLFKRSDIGQYKLSYIDSSKSIIHKVTISVDSSVFGDQGDFGQDFSSSDAGTTVSVEINSSDKYLNNYMKQATQAYDEVVDALNAGYELDETFPYRDAYEALLAEKGFLSQLQHYIRTSSRISTKMQNARAMTEAISSSLNVQASTIAVSISARLAAASYVTVTFPDQTKIDVKIDTALVNGELAIDVVNIEAAYTNDGRAVPLSKYELRGKSFSGGGSLGEYLNSLSGVTVISYGGSTTGGSGNEPNCTSEFRCNETGERCVSTVSCG